MLAQVNCLIEKRMDQLLVSMRAIIDAKLNSISNLPVLCLRTTTLEMDDDIVSKRKSLSLTKNKKSVNASPTLGLHSR
jgi:hypothetical protein